MLTCFTAVLYRLQLAALAQACLNNDTAMLLSTDRTELPSDAFVSESGTVFAVFDERTQDSGNVSYGVAVGDRRYFVKTAGRPDDRQRTTLDRDARIALLRNAVGMSRSVVHTALPALRHVVESREGPILVYDWADGELLGVPRSERSNPNSAFARFRRLPVPRILPVLDAIIELHDTLAAEGWIAVDFYDGSLIYDFDVAKIHVVDLDHYHVGPFVNEMGRMFGSTRFMAPEEFERGAEIDERTTVFLMGRTVLELLSNHIGPESSKGLTELLEVARRACQPDRRERYVSVARLCAAWKTARARG